jgi:hypothetical protein
MLIQRGDARHSPCHVVTTRIVSDDPASRARFVRLDSMTMRTAIAGLAIAVIGAASIRAAHAGACPDAHLQVLVPEHSAVPTNFQVRVVFQRDQPVEVIELVDPTTRQIKATGRVAAADAEVIVRKDGGAVVPADVHRTTASTRPVITVQPQAPLDPMTRYVVVVRTKQQDFVVARFTTENDPDASPPALAPVVKAQLFTWHFKTPDWKDPSGSFAEVTVSGVTGAAGFEIHELQPGDTASETTLRAIVTGTGPRLRFGSLDACSDVDLRFPAVSKGARSQPWKLAIRAFDLAGNVSPLRDFTIDLAKPRLTRR